MITKNEFSSRPFKDLECGGERSDAQSTMPAVNVSVSRYLHLSMTSARMLSFTLFVPCMCKQNEKQQQQTNDYNCRIRTLNQIDSQTTKWYMLSQRKGKTESSTDNRLHRIGSQDSWPSIALKHGIWERRIFKNVSTPNDFHLNVVLVRDILVYRGNGNSDNNSYSSILDGAGQKDPLCGDRKGNERRPDGSLLEGRIEWFGKWLIFLYGKSFSFSKFKGRLVRARKHITWSFDQSNMITRLLVSCLPDVRVGHVIVSAISLIAFIRVQFQLFSVEILTVSA